jgi:hypothetical protein
MRETTQRRRWIGWPLTVGILLSACGSGGLGGAPTTTPIASPSDAETAQPSVSAEPSASGEPSALPSGPFGAVWQMDPAVAFEDPGSCENHAGLPTQEFGENVAWRISYPGDWSAQESLTGPCMWFGPEPWEPDLENTVPPDEVAIQISVLDGRVTPGSQEFEGGTVTQEEMFTVAGVPAMRYEVSASDGERLVGDGVIWVIGVQGQLPDFDELLIRNYMIVYTSSPDAGQLGERVDVLDRMVATLELLVD